MPLMSGLYLTGEIKKLAPGTRIVLISADDNVRQEALNAGTNMFQKSRWGLE